MVDYNNREYIAGRGVPAYLLDRVDNDSSIYSDGASRIFNETGSSITTDNDAQTSRATNISCSPSSYTLSSDCGISSTPSTFEPISSQNQLSWNMPLMLDRADEITISSDISATSDRYLINTTSKQLNEVTMLSHMSLMDTSCSVPMYLTTDDERNVTVKFADNSVSGNFTAPEDMFPPYVRILSQDEDEVEQEDQPNDSLKGLCHIRNKTM